MTTVKKQRAVDAGGFVDEVLNDILSAPETEILEDDKELTAASGETADEFVERAVQASKIALGKERFAETATELRRSQKNRPAPIAPADVERTRQRYIDSVNTAQKELSLAARRGTKVTKSDSDSAIEDLAELQKIQKRQPEK